MVWYRRHTITVVLELPTFPVSSPCRWLLTSPTATCSPCTWCWCCAQLWTCSSNCVTSRLLLDLHAACSSSGPTPVLRSRWVDKLARKVEGMDGRTFDPLPARLISFCYLDPEDSGSLWEELDRCPPAQLRPTQSIWPVRRLLYSTVPRTSCWKVPPVWSLLLSNIQRPDLQSHTGKIMAISGLKTCTESCTFRVSNTAEKQTFASRKKNPFSVILGYFLFHAKWIGMFPVFLTFFTFLCSRSQRLAKMWSDCAWVPSSSVEDEWLKWHTEFMISSEFMHLLGSPNCINSYEKSK